jgi:hypothetical protein
MAYGKQRHRVTTSERGRKVKVTYRLEPAISQQAGNGQYKPRWILRQAKVAPDGSESVTSFGAYDTIKAGKKMAAHLKRKPITV